MSPLLRKAGSSALLRVGDALATGEDCCCEIPTWPNTCGVCTSGTVALYYQITIAGVTDETCTVCDDVNGIYVVEFTSASNTTCGDVTEFSAICNITCGDRTGCGFRRIYMSINHFLGRVTVRLECVCDTPAGTGARDMLWRQSGPGNTNPVIPSDCRFSGLVLPNANVDFCPSGSGAMCDGTGSTATIDALFAP